MLGLIYFLPMISTTPDFGTHFVVDQFYNRLHTLCTILASKNHIGHNEAH